MDLDAMDSYYDNVSEAEELQPSIGIVSRRVFHSPLVKLLFPARIRDEHKNDIIFIGENLIQLKEWDAEQGTLREIAIKADFGSTIRCGCMLGENLPSTRQDRTGIRRSKSTKITHCSLPPQILVLSLASFELVLLTVAEDDIGFPSFQMHAQKLPAFKDLEQAGKLIATDLKSRAIAISATEQTLVLYATASASQRATLTLSQVVLDELILPVDLVILKMDFLCPPAEEKDSVVLVVIGIKMTRTLAYIYSWDSRDPLRPSSIQIKKQTLGKELGIPVSLIPLKTAGYFMLVGDQSRFLYLSSTDGSVQQTDSEMLENPGDPNWPTLSPHILSRRKPLWTSWAKPARSVDWLHETIYLGREDGAIQYVEVRAKPWSNHLVFDLSGHAGYVDGSIDMAFAVLDMPLSRRDEQNQPQDDNNATMHKNYTLGYPDLLVVPGNSSDGGLYEIGFALPDGDSASHRRADIHISRMRVVLPNWAPLNNLCVIDGGSAQKQTTMHPFSHWKVYMEHVLRSYHTRPHHRLLVTSGKEPYGAIAEIRQGFEIRCKMPRRLPTRIMDQDPDLDLSYCNGIWPVQLSPTHILILFSFPWRTVFAMVNAETLDLALVESEAGGLIVCDEQTLTVSRIAVNGSETAMGCLDPAAVRETIVVHVTATRVQVLKPSLTLQSSPASISASVAKSWSHENVFAAASQRNGPLLLLATQANQAESVPRISLMCVGSVNDEYTLTTLGRRVEFEEDISCVAFLEHCKRTGHREIYGIIDESTCIDHYAAVGTSSGKFHLFAIDPKLGLRKILEHDTRCESLNLASLAAIERIAAIQRPAGLGASFIILCGSRQGMLIALHIQLGDIINVKDTRALDFGHGPLNFVSDADRPGNAFVCCGPDLCLVDFTRGDLNAPETTNLFYTDPQNRSYSHGTMNALCYFSGAHFNGPLSGCLMGSSNSEIVIGHIDYREQHLPIRHKIPGSPKQLLYSDHIKSLVVACTVTQIYQGNRLAIATIGLVDPDLRCVENASQEQINEYDFKFSSFCFGSGETLRDMMEWFITKNDRHYHFLVATTSLAKKDGEQGGRMVFLRPTPLDDGKLVMKFIFDKLEADPVSAVTQGEDGSLIYCCGNSIMMRIFDPETNRFEKRILRSKMPSPGIRISVWKSIVTVTTQLHSTLEFCFDDSGQFTEYGSDNRPRAGISHLSPLADACTFTYMTSMSGSMSSIRAWEQLEPREAVEAPVPSHITSLARITSRPKWRRLKRRPNTVVDRDIIGTATDGSLYTFTIVNDAGLRLLYFIQTLCLRDERICPLNTEEALVTRSLSPQASVPAHSHIDGEILCRLLDKRDAATIFNEMVSEEPWNNSIHPESGIIVDYDSPSERRSVLMQLVEEALQLDSRGEDSPESDEDGIDEDADRLRILTRLREENDVIHRALNYMRAVLEKPF